MKIINQFGLFKLFVSMFLFLISQTVLAQPVFTLNFTPSQIGPGSNSKLVYNIQNNSGTAALDLAFSNSLPAAISLSTPSNVQSDCGEAVLTAVDGGDTVVMSGGELASFSSCSVSVNVTSINIGTWSNTTGNLTSSLGDSGFASGDLVVSNDRPGFSKSFSPAVIHYGERSTLSFVIDNSLNPNLLSSLNFNDQLPDGMVIANPANVVNDCLNGVVAAVPNSQQFNYTTPVTGATALAAGEVCTVSVDVKGTAIGSSTNVSGVFNSFNQVFQNVSNGFATSELSINNSGDLILVQDFINDPANVGGTVDLAFTLSNFNRLQSATNINFTNDLDATLAGLIATDLPQNGVCGVGSVLSGTSLISLTGASLEPEASCSFTVSLQIPGSAVAGAYVNVTSAVTANESLGDASAETLFINDAPVLSKTFLNNPVAPGETVTIQFSITNSSSTTGASAITFTDNIDTFLSGATVATLPANGFCGAGSSAITAQINAELNLIINGANLNPGASCIFEVGLFVPLNTPAGTYASTTSLIVGTIDGMNQTGQAATDSLTVLASPDMQLIFTDDPVLPGDTVNARIQINYDELATGEITNMAFSWDLDGVISGMTAQSLPINDVCGVGSALSGTGVLNFVGGTLQAGQSCVFNVVLQVPISALPGLYTSATSTLSGSVMGVNTLSSAASDRLVIAGLTFSKQFVESPIEPGPVVTLEYTIENNSVSNSAIGMLFFDNINATLAGLNYSGPVLTDPCGAGSQLSGTTNLFLTGGNLSPLSSCTFSVTLNVPVGAASGQYISSTSNLNATINGSPVVIAPAIASLEINKLLLALDMTFPEVPVAAGDTVTVEYEISNLSQFNDLNNITWSHDLDATLTGLTAVGVPINDFCGAGSTISGSGLLTLTGASLPQGASCTFSVQLQIPANATDGSYPSTSSALSGQIPTNGFAVMGDPGFDDLLVSGIQLNLNMSFDNPTDAGRTTWVHYSLENLSVNAVTEFRFAHFLGASIPGFQVVGDLPVAPCGIGSHLLIDDTISIENASIEANSTCQFSLQFYLPETQAFGVFQSTTSEITIAGQPIALGTSAELIVEGELSVKAARVADYWFNNNLSSDVLGAPDLLFPGSLNYSTDLVAGKNKAILPFAAGDGFTLLTGQLNVVDEYTLVMLLSLDTLNNYVKLADFSGLAEDLGWYVDNNSGLSFYNIAFGQVGTVLPDVYYQMILTRKPNGELTGYLNGVQQFSTTDSNNEAIADNFEQVIDLMIDDISSGSSENSAGKMARITLFDVPFDQTEVDNFPPLGDIIFFNGFDFN